MKEQKNVNSETVVEKAQISKENQKIDKKGKITLIIIGVIIALLAIGAVCFQLIFNKASADIFEQAIIKTFDNAEQVIDKYVPEKINLKEKDISIAANMAFDTTLDLGAYNDIKDYTVNFNVDASYSKKIMKINLGIKESNEDFLTANIFSQDNKIYGNLPELYSKTVFLDNYNWDDDITTEVTNISKEDLKIITQNTKQMVLSLIDKKLIKETKNVSALEKQNLTEISYTFDKSNQKQSLEKMLEYIKNNEQYLEALTKIMGQTKDEIIEDFEFLIEEYEYSKDLKISIYTEGALNQVIGAIITDDSNIITIEGKKISFEEESNKITIEEKEKEFLATIDVDGFEGTMNIKFDELKSEKFSSSIDINIKYNEETYKIKLDFSFDLTGKIEKEKIEDEVSIKSITTEEFQTIYSKFFEKIKGTLFEEFINELFYSFV